MKHQPNFENIRIAEDPLGIIDQMMIHYNKLRVQLGAGDRKVPYQMRKDERY